MVYGLKRIKNGFRIISADKPEGDNLINTTIFHLDNNSNLVEKITSKKLILKITIGS